MYESTELKKETTVSGKYCCKLEQLSLNNSELLKKLICFVFWNNFLFLPDWMSCTKQMTCSETCLQEYMRKYGTKCTGGLAPTCQDYARIHNGGPRGCTKENTMKFWTKVKQCCDQIGGCDWVAWNNDTSFIITFHLLISIHKARQSIRE